MKTFILPIVLGLFFLSCNSDDNVLEVNSEHEISFEIEKTNSDSNFVSKVKSIELNQKLSAWIKGDQGNMNYIVKGAYYDITLENGEIIEFGISFRSYNENVDELTFDKEEESLKRGSNWDYKSSEKEAENFYRNSDVFFFVNLNRFSTNSNSDNLNALNIETVMIDGVEKSLLTIDFQNVIAEGVADELGTPREIYKLTNGYYQGIIE